MNTTNKKNTQNASNNQNTQRYQQNTPTSQISSPNNANMNQSFASVTKKQNVLVNFPKKEEAIIINYIEGTDINEYLTSVGQIVGPKNMTYFSKISNQRICIYFINKQIVEQIVTQYRTITINGTPTEIRRYITPAKRIIITNLTPCIPHTIVEAELNRLGMQIMSPMLFLKLGIQDPDYAHIMSFKRQVYVKENQNIDIPNSIQIEYEDVVYRAFLYTDTMCYACKKNGHTANNCPNQTEKSTIKEQVNIPTQSDTPNNKIENINEANQPSTSQIEKNPIVTQKRSANSLSSQEDDLDLTLIDNSDTEHTNDSPKDQTQEKEEKSNNNKKNVEKPKPKKKRSESPGSNINIEELTKPIRKIMKAQPKQFELTYDELIQFIEDLQGSTEYLKIAREYTNDVPKLLKNLNILYGYLENATIKSRFTRLRNRIKEQLEEEEEGLSPESETETLQS